MFVHPPTGKILRTTIALSSVLTLIACEGSGGGTQGALCV